MEVALVLSENGKKILEKKGDAETVLKACNNCIDKK